jgi:hypothetical protein
VSVQRTLLAYVLCQAMRAADMAASAVATTIRIESNKLSIGSFCTDLARSP